MTRRDRHREGVNKIAWAVSSAVVLALSLRETGAWLVLRQMDELPTEIDGAISSDVELRSARARGRLDAGEVESARDDLDVALSLRPRDLTALMLASRASGEVAERLRLAAVAARAAPYALAPSEFALATAFAAVRERAPRAAAARENARRLRAIGTDPGVDESLLDATRLENEMRAYLEMAISVHGAMSPRARRSQRLDESLARARALTTELGAP